MSVAGLHGRILFGRAVKIGDGRRYADAGHVKFHGVVARPAAYAEIRLSFGVPPFRIGKRHGERVEGFSDMLGIRRARKLRMALKGNEHVVEINSPFPADFFKRKFHIRPIGRAGRRGIDLGKGAVVGIGGGRQLKPAVALIIHIHFGTEPIAVRVGKKYAEAVCGNRGGPAHAVCGQKEYPEVAAVALYAELQINPVLVRHRHEAAVIESVPLLVLRDGLRKLVRPRGEGIGGKTDFRVRQGRRRRLAVSVFQFYRYGRKRLRRRKFVSRLRHLVCGYGIGVPLRVVRFDDFRVCAVDE